ncbi:MAG TPA: CAP domain-containing protein [Terracidiphilus sp.]|nr:CAP domain-containing protein [Terracidiphilus sp.]
MDIRKQGMWLVFLLAVPAVALGQQSRYGRQADGAVMHGAAEQLFALANQARAEAGAPELKWDSALAVAALRHCERMAAEGPIAHRYGGEMSLTERAGAAGAHFSLIEENVAVGAYPAQIHDGWMHSTEHRKNLLNPEVNRVGIGVVESHGALYAVEDFERFVEVLSAAEVEAQVESLIRVSGIRIRREHGDARAACTMNQGLPARLTGGEPMFVMRWQSADLSQLPRQLAERLGGGRFRMAEVGACPAHSAENSFTVYRVAVLLY